MYIIGSDLIPQFVKVSSKNIDQDGKHIETLAFLIGYFEKDNYIATDLIFPSQHGQPHKVDDLGKQIYILSNTRYFFSPSFCEFDTKRGTARPQIKRLAFIKKFQSMHILHRFTNMF